MKYLKYTGLYFAMTAIGISVLSMAEANRMLTALFFGGSFLWYMASTLEKDI